MFWNNAFVLCLVETSHWCSGGAGRDWCLWLHCVVLMWWLFTRRGRERTWWFVTARTTITGTWHHLQIKAFKAAHNWAGMIRHLDVITVVYSEDIQHAPFKKCFWLTEYKFLFFSGYIYILTCSKYVSVYLEFRAWHTLWLVRACVPVQNTTHLKVCFNWEGMCMFCLAQYYWPIPHPPKYILKVVIKIYWIYYYY